MAEWELILTGTGTSHGNPPWGNPNMWSNDPRDHRRRSGAILKGPGGEVILIDAGPDLMHQLRDPYKRTKMYEYPTDCICRCDGVLITHDHADHCHGLNDLRHLNRLMGSEIPLYAHESHLNTLLQMFPYCFRDAHAVYEMSSPALRAIPIKDGENFNICGIDVQSFYMSHGPAGRTSGFRLGKLAYLTDLKEIPEETLETVLNDIEVLVIDMLRDETHETHLNWEEAETLIQRIKPLTCYLVHMGYEVCHSEWLDRLPDNIIMSYDGLSVQVQL